MRILGLLAGVGWVVSQANILPNSSVGVVLDLLETIWDGFESIGAIWEISVFGHFWPNLNYLPLWILTKFTSHNLHLKSEILIFWHFFLQSGSTFIGVVSKSSELDRGLLKTCSGLLQRLHFWARTDNAQIWPPRQKCARARDRYFGQKKSFFCRNFLCSCPF